MHCTGANWSLEKPFWKTNFVGTAEKTENKKFWYGTNGDCGLLSEFFFFSYYRIFLWLLRTELIDCILLNFGKMSAWTLKDEEIFFRTSGFWLLTGFSERRNRRSLVLKETISLEFCILSTLYCWHPPTVWVDSVAPVFSIQVMCCVRKAFSKTLCCSHFSSSDDDFLFALYIVWF